MTDVTIYPKSWTLLDPSTTFPPNFKWPVSMLVDAVGSSAGAAGEHGAVPKPAAGTQRRALAGSCTFVTELELTAVTLADGTKIAGFSSTGNADCRLELVAADAATRTARLKVVSQSGLVAADASAEPVGLGRWSERGDPLRRTCQATRFVTANAFDTTLTVDGFPTPRLEFTGSLTPLDDADGIYLQFPTAASANSWAGIDWPVIQTKRQLNPALYIEGRTPLLQSRFIVGLLTAPPRLASDTKLAKTTDLANAVLQTASSAIQVIASTKEYVRTTGSWIDEGHYVGGTPTMANFAQGGNNGVKSIVALSALRMQVSNNCTDEAAGAAVTVTTTGICGAMLFYDHSITQPVSSAASLVVNAAAKTLTRSDGGNFITDGHRVGNIPTTYTGLLAGNITALTGQALTDVSTTVLTYGGASGLTNETTGAATVSGPISQFLRANESSGPAYSLVRNCTVTGGGLLHRTDGGNWTDDGIKEGQLLTIVNMANPANNQTIRVALVGPANITPVNLTLVTDTNAANATVSGGGQAEYITPIDVGQAGHFLANNRFRLRLMYLGNFLWEIANYDFVNLTWEHLTILNQQMVAGASGLRVFWALRTNTSTVRMPAISRLALS